MKNLEISKELLSEVLELDVTNYKYPSFGTYIDYSTLYVIYKKENIEYSLLVNIYELAHKCKEWARDKYDITVSSSIYKKYAKAWDISNDKSYIADTEVEAIFKACQWILENKDK